MAEDAQSAGFLAQVPEPPEELRRQPLVENLRGFAWISDRIAGVAEGKTPRWWWAAFIPSTLVMLLCFSMIATLAIMLGVSGR